MLFQVFGNRVKTIREKQGLSQKRLSELTGIVREQISRIEHGQINTTLETLYKLSLAFSMPMKTLLDFEVDMVVPQYDIEKENYKIKPFVKWAGGKTQILHVIKEMMPKKYNTYYEPFIGGGALFFDIKPKHAVINDSNEELMAAYHTFNNSTTYSNLVHELINHERNHSEEYYYKIREIDRNLDYQSLPLYVKAARMIYLNKACFNGLYRVNSKGFFNVPSGKKLKVKAYDKENFEGINNYFVKQEIHVLSTDFETAVEQAKSGDFVYFDPPYDTFEDQNNFTSYAKDGFGKIEQQRLANLFKKLDKKGVYVMLSNHKTKFVMELYNGYNIRVINAKRMINSDPSGRGDVEEVIITNYK